MRLPARIVAEGGEQVEAQLETRDISAKGAFLYTAKPALEGASVILELVLPVDKFKQLLFEQSDVKLKVTGIVLRTEPKGMAVRFDRKYEIIPDGGPQTQGVPKAD
jgi:hypothetical protein